MRISMKVAAILILGSLGLLCLFIGVGCLSVLTVASELNVLSIIGAVLLGAFYIACGVNSFICLFDKEK